MADSGRLKAEISLLLSSVFSISLMSSNPNQMHAHHLSSPSSSFWDLEEHAWKLSSSPHSMPPHPASSASPQTVHAETGSGTPWLSRLLRFVSLSCSMPRLVVDGGTGPIPPHGIGWPCAQGIVLILLMIGSDPVLCLPTSLPLPLIPRQACVSLHLH